jgi:hypothetical protein
MREMINVYRILVGKPEGKRPVRRPRHRWNIISKLILMKYVGWQGVDWIHLPQDADLFRELLKTILNPLI